MSGLFEALTITVNCRWMQMSANNVQSDIQSVSDNEICLPAFVNWMTCLVEYAVYLSYANTSREQSSLIRQCSSSTGCLYCMVHKQL